MRISCLLALLCLLQNHGAVDGWSLRRIFCNPVASSLSASVSEKRQDGKKADASDNSLSSAASRQKPPAFLMKTFERTECDNVNTPPSLSILLRSLKQLLSGGTDIRGIYTDHPLLGSISSVSHMIGKLPAGSPPALTPLAAYCIGYALAQRLLQTASSNDDIVTIAVGRDPRPHGMRLADAVCRGANSVDNRIRTVYTDLATTPACAAFCQLPDCAATAAVMITASHLPADRNGLKMYTSAGCLSATDIQNLYAAAAECANTWYSAGMLPPSSGNKAVLPDERVDWMPIYAAQLKQAVMDQVDNDDDNDYKPLDGLTIVLNAGNGSGGFFNSVLKDLGADVSGSIHVEPDGSFPNSVPNPEYAPMLEATVTACQAVQADLGIMLDTDADRCGFVVPRRDDDSIIVGYEPLNRNRLIALLGVVFAQQSPGCAVVTDSVTSEGLTAFLEDNLGLQHVRYLKGYANVINKAKELTEANIVNAELAIETSGHCAMKENSYQDDGTYAAVKVVSLLARERSKGNTASLLDLIADLQEMDETGELRMTVKDGSLDTMQQVFDFCALEIERLSEYKDQTGVVDDWEIDTDNLEGIRIRIGNGQFFMLRKSLHDPIISLQIEGRSKDEVRKHMTEPLLKVFDAEEAIRTTLDLSVLKQY